MVPPDTTDEVLMSLIATGDSEAFRHFVERHQRLVIGIVTQMIGFTDAEDVAQQVFLNIWQAAPRWRPEAKVTTWMLTIAKRLVFNESRRRVRTRTLPQTQDEESEIDYPDSAPGPDSSLLSSELQQAIESAMALLPEKERLALVLRQQQGMPYEEIAEILGISLGAVKSLIFRGRETLKTRLKSYLD